MNAAIHSSNSSQSRAGVTGRVQRVGLLCCIETIMLSLFATGITRDVIEIQEALLDYRSLILFSHSLRPILYEI